MKTILNKSLILLLLLASSLLMIGNTNSVYADQYTGYQTTSNFTPINGKIFSDPCGSSCSNPNAPLAELHYDTVGGADSAGTYIHFNNGLGDFRNGDIAPLTLKSALKTFYGISYGENSYFTTYIPFKASGTQTVKIKIFGSKELANNCLFSTLKGGSTTPDMIFIDNSVNNITIGNSSCNDVGNDYYSAIMGNGVKLDSVYNIATTKSLSYLLYDGIVIGGVNFDQRNSIYNDNTYSSYNRYKIYFFNSIITNSTFNFLYNSQSYSSYSDILQLDKTYFKNISSGKINSLIANNSKIENFNAFYTQGNADEGRIFNNSILNTFVLSNNISYLYINSSSNSYIMNGTGSIIYLSSNSNFSNNIFVNNSNLKLQYSSNYFRNLFYNNTTIDFNSTTGYKLNLIQNTFFNNTNYNVNGVAINSTILTNLKNATQASDLTGNGLGGVGGIYQSFNVFYKPTGLSTSLLPYCTDNSTIGYVSAGCNPSSLIKFNGYSGTKITVDVNSDGYKTF